MSDLCKDCGHFYVDYAEPKDIGDNIPKKGSSPSPIPKYKCILGHRIAKSKDGWVPFTQDYTCDDFIENMF